MPHYLELLVLGKVLIRLVPTENELDSMVVNVALEISE